jgi:hypothetical protein
MLNAYSFKYKYFVHKSQQFFSLILFIPRLSFYSLILDVCTFIISLFLSINKNDYLLMVGEAACPPAPPCDFYNKYPCRGDALKIGRNSDRSTKRIA